MAALPIRGSLANRLVMGLSIISMDAPDISLLLSNNTDLVILGVYPAVLVTVRISDKFQFAYRVNGCVGKETCQQVSIINLTTSLTI